MMSLQQGKRNKHYNNNGSQRALHLQLTAQPPLLLLLSLMLCCEVIFMETIGAAELPAELLLEDIGLLKSMEHAQQQQQQQKQQLQQYQHASQQKDHMPHEQAKRYAFDTLNTGSADVGIDDMQPAEMSPADLARYERELFLQSAIDESSVAAADDVELPWEPESMEQHADLMERAIDYNQQQPSAGGMFLKLHHPHQQQHHHQQQLHHLHHRLSGGDTAGSDSVTLAPPAMPVAAPQRHCAFVISTKVTGVCQAAPIGTPCMAGEHMDVYNQDCM